MNGQKVASITIFKMANIIIFISVIPFNVFTTDQLEYFHQLIIRMFISLTKYNFKSDVEA